LQRKDVLDLGAGRRFAPGSALSLKGCLDWQESSSRFRRVDSDGEAVETRARVLAPQRQFVGGSEIQLSEAVSAKSVNGNGACRPGKRLGFPEEGVPTKMVVAVDVDEGIVMRSFTVGMCISWLCSVKITCWLHSYFFSVEVAFHVASVEPYCGLNIIAKAMHLM
jgi:hypothetical protein